MKRLAVCIFASWMFPAAWCCTPVDAGDLDAILAAENAEKGVTLQAVDPVDDMGFSRRVCLDLAGRIPTGKEISQYLKWPADQRRDKLIAKYMQDEGFANRWSAFFADMLRIRSNEEGGTQLLAYVHNAITTDMPYDEMCRRMISANGKAGRTPEIGFVLGDDADPMALASATAQVFMGIRISCAQCHDHPFDKWTREDFYSVAAYFGKTIRRENNLTKTVYTTEQDKSMVLWPPEDESEPDARSPMKPSFPFPYLDESERLEFLTRLEKLRANKEAEAAGNSESGPSVDDLLAAAGSKTKQRLSGGFGAAMKVSTEAKSDIRKIDVNAELYKRSQLRDELSRLVTSPRNRYFARLLVNRVWKDLVGTGFVEPIDDFRDSNPASHPKTMDYLAEEFVANDFSFRWLVKEIVSSDAYQRAHVALDADEQERAALEQAFLATPMRRMKAEAMYDSIVTAGHLFAVKHLPGENPRVIKRRIRVPVDPDPNESADGDGAMEDEPTEEMMQGEMVASAVNYGLEKSIELDFGALLSAKDDTPMIDSMKKMTREEIEAMRMKSMPQQNNPRRRYVSKLVDETIDDNPKFSSAYRMATPAPAGHFLRLFGQPSRVDLGEDRYDNSSMRQALMMLNGRLTHEAARVGPLEPVYKMMTGANPDFRKAVRYTYFEILTRLPSEDEIAEAIAVIDAGEDKLTGMADLRWILLNCNEFRFMP
ncbi:MAG: DUF1553 domain-containing protein [Pirellulaceae bacterium]|nr:DUF1553 domain-containing protein [Pirellulaceae bacterium]